jgi:hypothetical protein
VQGEEVISWSFGVSAADEGGGTGPLTKFHIAVNLLSSIFWWHQISILGLHETAHKIDGFHEISKGRVIAYSRNEMRIGR